MSNSNKKINSIILGFSIAAIAYILLFLLIPFPKRAASWISFSFTVISVAAGLAICLYAFGGKDTLISKLYGFPVFRIGYLYVAAQLIAGVIICLIAAFVAVPYWVALAVSILLAAAAAIGVLVVDNARDYVEEMEEDAERVTKAVKLFQLNISAIVDCCTDTEIKKELEKLEEKFRFSDPVSSPATEEIEARLSTKLDVLKSLVSSTGAKPEEIRRKITDLNQLLAERNRICKASK